MTRLVIGFLWLLHFLPLGAIAAVGNTLGRRAQAEVTLIERTRTHVWKPKLHEIAAGSMDMSAHEVGYLAQSHWHHFRYRVGEMTGLDRARRLVGGDLGRVAFGGQVGGSR